MNQMLYEQNTNKNYDNNATSVTNEKKYRFNNVPTDFMKNDMWRQAVLELVDLCSSTRQQQDEIDTMYSTFCDTVYNEMDTYLQYTSASKKTRKYFKTQKPFWNETLTTMWKTMNSLEHVYLKNKSNRREKYYKKQAFMNSRKSFDKELRKAERLYNKNTLDEIESVCTENPRAFWDYIKKLGPRKVNEIPMQVYVNGSLTSDTNTVLNKWKSDFGDLYNKSENVNENFDQVFYNDTLQQKYTWEQEMVQPNYENNGMLNTDISFDEVEKMTRNLKYRKACGFDKIPNEVLKISEIHVLLFNMYRMFFNYGMTPTVWLKSIIVPIPKSSTKDPHIPLNYRGISLLSCVCKGYSSILNKRIVAYCEELNIFAEEQNGFRRDRSCTDHIFSFTSIVQNRLSENLPTFTCFIDMQKAFDWVDRDLLFYKLLQNNIDGRIYNAVKALYSNPVAQIKLNKAYTEWFETNSGVKQGDCLSPTLFGIYINDLVSELNSHDLGVKLRDVKVSILLFADDIVLIAESAEKLQLMLNIVHEWCRKWKLIVNKEKTKIVHFRNPRQARTEVTFKYGECVLEIVDKYKYLGTLLNEHLNFNITADVLASAGGRALGAVISKFSKFRNVGFTTFSKLFESSVLPIMEYASEVWGYKGYIKCERVQQRAARYYLGVHSKTPLLALSGDIGWLNTHTLRLIKIAKFWNRLINMDETRLTKKLFLYDKSVCKNNWSADFKCLCNSVGMNEMFDNLTQVDINMFTSNLITIDATRWKSDIILKPKLRTYVKFKDTFVTEDYVKYCLSRRKRSLLAQFRMGVLPLAIETGRFKGINVNERYCKFCPDLKVEDEQHMLCECSLYIPLRTVLYENVAKNLPEFNYLNSEEKFIYLLSNEWKHVANFLDKAWTLRTKKLYNST